MTETCRRHVADTTQNVAIWAKKRHADIRHVELRAEINTEREKRLNAAWLVDIGVFPTFEELYSQVEMRAKDPSIGGGAFSVRRDSTTPATSRRWVFLCRQTYHKTIDRNDLYKSEGISKN